MSFPRMNLIIPTTGNPKIIEPLLESIVKNTVGSYTVVILKQKTEHLEAKKVYEKWQNKYPEWKFLDGTDNMILTARNLGILENYIPVNPQEGDQWFAEMDDDIILPPNWDEDMIKAAEEKPDGAVFVPLLTFRSILYYKYQVAVLPLLAWQAMKNGKIEELNEFYSKYYAVEEPKLTPCLLPEYSFILRRNRSGLNVLPLLWDTAFDVVRNASRANEDLMMKLKQFGRSAWIVQSVMIFHRCLNRDRFHPKRHYAATTLSNYVLQKWPEYKGNLVGEWLNAWGAEDKMQDANKNMPKGLPPEAIPYFEIENE